MSTATAPPAVDAPPDDRPPLAKDRSFRGLLVTQLLGAFNDNVFKQAVLLVAVAFAADAGLAGGPQSLATAVFSLPFLLSCITGVLSDKVSKRSIVVACKGLEVVVMLAATAVFFTTPPDSRTQFAALLAVLGLMAFQSTIFGPAKYGVLPELFRDSDLPRANGWMQGSTFLAIILGTALAGLLKETLGPSVWLLGLFCVAVAAAGTATSLWVRSTPPADPAAKLTAASVWPDARTRGAVLGEPRLRLALLVYSTFWMLGSTLIAAVNAFGTRQMGYGEFATSLLAAGMGLGIGGGCVAAARMSEGRVDFGLVRLGAAGVAFAGAAAAVLPLLLPAGRVSYVASVLALIGVGIFSGLLAVPLQTYIQAAPPAGVKGRAVGLMNALNAVGMVLGAGLYWACSAAFGAGKTSLTFAVVGAVIAPAAVMFRGGEDEA